MNNLSSSPSECCVSISVFLDVKICHHAKKDGGGKGKSWVVFYLFSKVTMEIEI